MPADETAMGDRPQSKLVLKEATGKTVDRIVAVSEFADLYEIIFTDGTMLVAEPAQGRVALSYRDRSGAMVEADR
jgi:hypothetical protein